MIGVLWTLFRRMAKAPDWNGSDSEGRKLGEQRGLDRTIFLLHDCQMSTWQCTVTNDDHEKSVHGKDENRFLKTPVVLAVNDAR